MNSFMSWVGGKKALREEVLARFPTYYERYIEVFGGAGWVLFHKPPGMDFEVWNDYNGNLANLYRCVRENPNKLKYKLRYVLNSREDFERIANLHKNGIFPKLCDVDRAAKFYQLIRYSYASGLDSFASQPHSIWSDFPMIDLAARRLQKVIIENKDFEKLIRQYDRPVSFFYCDPPYFATENYYKDVGFKTKDHIRLRDTLLGISGKFLVSYNDCPEIREIWNKPNIHIEEISRLNNLAQRYDGGCQYAELFIIRTVLDINDTVVDVEIEEPEPTEQFANDDFYVDIPPQFDESEQSENALSGFLKIEKDDQTDNNLYYKLGAMFKNGFGTEADISKAVEYFNKSADMNKWSSYQLGRLYLFGAEGLEKDKEKAVEWLTKSANDGNEYAQNLLDNIDDFESQMLRNTVMGLFVNLSRCIEDDYYKRYNSVRQTVDKKLKQMIRLKKQDMGIKDDNTMAMQ